MLDRLLSGRGWKVKKTTPPAGKRKAAPSEWVKKYGGPGVREDGTLDDGRLDVPGAGDEEEEGTAAFPRPNPNRWLEPEGKTRTNFII